MLRGIGYISVFLICFGTHLFSKAEEIDQQSSDPNHQYSGLTVHVDTDKILFRENEPIDLKVAIMDSLNQEILSIFPNKDYFNYYVEVYSRDGISIPEKDEFFARRFNDIQAQRSMTPSVRSMEIRLATKQIMGEVIDLTTLFQLPVGHYLVRVKFYPKTVLLDPLSYIYSPFIQVIVEPQQEQIQKSLEMRQNWEKDRQNLRTPEDSVKAFFDAKREGNWDKFFYVLDLGRLITIFQEFNEAYQRGTSDQKDAVLQDFQKYLQDSNAGEDIRSVEFEESIIRKDQAIVKALTQISLHGRLLSREYIFKLEKQRHWVITAYTVVVR